MNSALPSHFHLRRIAAVRDDGLPVLDGTNAEVIATTRFRPQDAGLMAVCQEVVGDGTARIVALGLLQDAVVADPDAPLVIRHGAAAIALHPDGRIRLTGEDIGLDATAGLRLAAGWIDLN